jgi:coenzyme F420-reducing hydrogenase beta subunit
MACIDICPTNSIKVKDALKCLNAEINTMTCINCGLCKKVCQNNNPASLRYPFIWTQGWARDEIRHLSSSGGFGQEVIKSFIKNDGVVAACRLKEGDFLFEIVENLEDIQKFVGSKYVKSNPIGIYKKISNYLKKGKKVLFIGLPCQVSSLRNYTNDNEKLYTIDLICHGSPSVNLLRSSLKEYGFDIDTLENIYFRHNSEFGLDTSIKTVVPDGIYDCYTMAFLNGLDYTENCYFCHYAQLGRVGDLTIGDSWGTDLVDELSRGISLILCQTNKGKELLNMVDFIYFDVDLDRAITENHQLQKPSTKPVEREKFFNRLGKGMKFNDAVYKAYPKTYIKQKVKSLFIKINVLKSNKKY